MLSAYDFSLMFSMPEISPARDIRGKQYGFASPLRLTEKPNIIIAFA